MNIYRTEYPRPNFVRRDWICLNGIWDFCFDDNEKFSYKEIISKVFDKKINVPFVYQSKLSGINCNKIHDTVWYKRNFTLPKTWLNKKVLLHFKAVDYECEVWLNNQFIGIHEGGHTPFSFDVSFAIQRENIIILRVKDYTKDVHLPRGKQYWKEESEFIFYTSSTGIWQSVWLEPVEEVYIKDIYFTPNIDENFVKVDFLLNQKCEDIKVKIKIWFKGTNFEKDKAECFEDMYTLNQIREFRCIYLENFRHSGFEHWWSPENPNLYGIELTLFHKEKMVDRVESYFGMRKISIDNGNIYLNNKSYIQRLVLDQGYFPEGLLTASSVEDYKKDILLAKSMGFNGARKHQKVEDSVWLYWCDRLGFLVWGEMANAYDYNTNYVERITKEWIEVIKRDYNHPAIITWVPINESWGVPNINVDIMQQSHAKEMYYLTYSLDKTRLVLSNDGWEHICSDVLTVHDYEQEEEILNKRYQSRKEIEEFVSAGRKMCVGDYVCSGKPILLSEFGGISFEKDEKGWGYASVKTKEEFLTCLSKIFKQVYLSKHLQGFCYTQLTDIFSETNGLLSFNREPKVPLEKIKEIVEG